MEKWVAGFVTLGVAVVSASIVFQIVKPGSQGPAVVKSVVGGVTDITDNLFK